MSIQVHPSADGAEVQIRISDRFDFNVHRDFRKAYEGCSSAARRYVVDLRDTSYMDSSALGMLLQLREFAGASPDAISVVNAAPAIREILRIANFDKLMTIR